MRCSPSKTPFINLLFSTDTSYILCFCHPFAFQDNFPPITSGVVASNSVLLSECRTFLSPLPCVARTSPGISVQDLFCRVYACSRFSRMAGSRGKEENQTNQPPTNTQHALRIHVTLPQHPQVAKLDNNKPLPDLRRWWERVTLRCVFAETCTAVPGFCRSAS